MINIVVWVLFNVLQMTAVVWVSLELLIRRCFLLTAFTDHQFIHCVVVEGYWAVNFLMGLTLLLDDGHLKLYDFGLFWQVVAQNVFILNEVVYLLIVLTNNAKWRVVTKANHYLITHWNVLGPFGLLFILAGSEDALLVTGAFLVLCLDPNWSLLLHTVDALHIAHCIIIIYSF